MSRVIVFDVNETLLDLSALDPHFERVFGSAAVRGEWFRQMLLSAMTVALTERYHDFSEIAAAALTMTGERHGVTPSRRDREVIADTMRRLPPHPEVPDALDRLLARGRRLAALTNSASAAMHDQLANAGLARFFEAQISVDSVRRFKPALEVYRGAARELGVEPRQMMMVAAHGWDLAGAMSAGCATAFVVRPGQTLDPLYERPDVVGPDLVAVAEGILEMPD